MPEKQLTKSGTEWQEKVEECQVLLEEVRYQLIDAEAELAERMRAISAFETKLRARIEPLLKRLEILEAEIKLYRKKLRWLYEALDERENGNAPWSMDELGDVYDDTHDRYMGKASTAAASNLNTEEQVEIKQLYRQLARRFHPDMAVDEADRARRTQIMMAINSAYAAGDIEKLKDLALEPDTASRVEYAKTAQQLAQALWRELVQCRRRLAEIRRKLAALEHHKSAQLMRQAQRATAVGRDLLAEIAEGIKIKIAQATAKRDMLQSELEEANGEASFMEELDQDFDDGLVDPRFDRIESWLHSHRDRFYWESDDMLDDID